ncbi:MAG: hypothetical protein IJQ93_12255 [Bacteroidales bacterium]|nr:hypothetical protein [Clostridia bacterium]MBR0301071.1 hypothetical protein [Bacteroidales bacterium]
MDDYIRRGAAIEQFEDSTSAIPEKLARIRIEEVPAADVVEVVRCGQCKYCVEHYDTDGNAPYWTCKEWDSGTDYDGYCHYGERKEGGHDDGT